MNVDQLVKAQKLMAQAMACAANSLSNDRSVSEAKGHMRQAITKLDEAARKTQLRKKEQATEHQKWWGQLEATAKHAPMANVSQEAYSRTLEQLNAMIAEEKDKLNELEKNVQQKAKNPDLIVD